jgi:hypothetical protein
MYCIKMEKYLALPYSPQNICQTLLQLPQKLPDRWRSVPLVEHSEIKIFELTDSICQAQCKERDPGTANLSGNLVLPYEMYIL